MKNKIQKPRPLDEINLQAYRLLYKELGVVYAIRFLCQFQGFGNYNLERDELFANKTMDEIVNEIEERRKPGKEDDRYGPALLVITQFSCTVRIQL